MIVNSYFSEAPLYPGNPASIQCCFGSWELVFRWCKATKVGLRLIYNQTEEKGASDGGRGVNQLQGLWIINSWFIQLCRSRMIHQSHPRLAALPVHLVWPRLSFPPTPQLWREPDLRPGRGQAGEPGRGPEARRPLQRPPVSELRPHLWEVDEWGRVHRLLPLHPRPAFQGKVPRMFFKTQTLQSPFLSSLMMKNKCRS